MGCGSYSEDVDVGVILVKLHLNNYFQMPATKLLQHDRRHWKNNTLDWLEFDIPQLVKPVNKELTSIYKIISEQVKHVFSQNLCLIIHYNKTMPQNLSK